MCLSGDIYDLTAKQWEVIEAGMEFYKEATDIIKYGKTIKYENRAKSYNNPQGEQLVIREFCNKQLVIVHRFENSKEISLDFLQDKKIIKEYGDMDGDFTAKAWLIK